MYYILGLFAIAFLYFVIGAIASRKLRIKYFEVPSKNEVNLSGLKFVLLSDLHGRILKNNQDALVNAIKKENPTLIILCGDMVDYHDNNAVATEILIDKLNDTVPIIAVRGNHYYKGRRTAQNHLEKVFDKSYVFPLKNQRKIIYYKDYAICIDGLDDPSAVVSWKGLRRKEELKRNRAALKNALDLMLEENPKSDYNIMVCHRPTDMDLFEHAGYDLALCGHTHGGQWAMPFGIEVLGDEATLFPPENMQSGMHKHKKMSLIITSGIGYSNIKLRTFKPPEIAVITFG